MSSARWAGLVLELREEQVGLLAARGEEIDPREDGEERLALGGRVSLARVRHHPGADGARRRDVADETVDRHRGDHHHFGGVA